MPTWDQVEELLQKAEPSNMGCGAENRSISNAERTLGVRFPRSYIAFLERYGWLWLDDDRIINGVDSLTPDACDVVWITLCGRTEMKLGLPPWLVSIMKDTAGNDTCLDTSRMKDGECPVVFWDQEAEDGWDQIPAIVAGSFIEWLVSMLKGHIAKADNGGECSHAEFTGPGYTAELVGRPYPRFAPEENVDVLVRLEDGTAYAGVLVTLRYFEYEFRASADSGEHGQGSYAFWVGMVIVRDFKRGTLQHALDALVETGDIDCCFIRQVEGEDDDTEGSDG